jgi:LAO/AO transport system kinase
MESTLSVMAGVNEQENTNKDAIDRFKQLRRRKPGADEYIEGIRKGDIGVLGRAITLIESALPEDEEVTHEIIEKSLPFSGNSVRIGITGVPGVGKSTFIEELGNRIINQGHKLAVLAIDPSSEKTKGSILGDKTRMEKLSASSNAFIRPSPSSGTLGGVARKTRESIILCEAAGFDTIFIETVGVGQSETAVCSMVDFFLLLMLAGAGDELQGIKRGIMEMADGIVITKADGGNALHAIKAQAEYKNAVHLFPAPASQWETQVLTCSSKEGMGIDHVWEAIGAYCRHTRQNGYFDEKRAGQTKYWMYEAIQNQLKQSFYNQVDVREALKGLENRVLQNKTSPFKAASQLLKIYFDSNR